MHIERPRRLLPARASCTPRTVKLRKCESHRARAPRRPRPAPDHPASRVSGWERRGVERASGSGRHIPPSVSVRVLLLRQAVFSLCSAQPPLRTLARSGLYHSSTREHADSPPLDRPPRFFRARAGGGHWPAGPTGRLVAQNFEDRLEFSRRDRARSSEPAAPTGPRVLVLGSRHTPTRPCGRTGFALRRCDCNVVWSGRLRTRAREIPSCARESREARGCVRKIAGYVLAPRAALPARPLAPSVHPPPGLCPPRVPGPPLAIVKRALDESKQPFSLSNIYAPLHGRIRLVASGPSTTPLHDRGPCSCCPRRTWTLPTSPERPCARMSSQPVYDPAVVAAYYELSVLPFACLIPIPR